MTAATAIYDDIDDALGARAQRYFSEGYKRVERQLDHVVLAAPTENAPGRLDATARVQYPSDWSTKRVGKLRAHLSTVDALQLSVDMAQSYLLGCGLPADVVPELWLRSVSMRSGPAPLEDLERFAVSAVVAPQVTGTVLGARLVGFTCTVGTIRTRLQVAVPMDRVDLDLDAPLTQAPTTPLTTRYRGRAHTIGNVRIDAGGTGGSAYVGVRDDPSSTPLGTEFGDAYQPSLGPLDALLILAQVAQVLVYEQDQMRRSNSNTLWMRTFGVSARCPVQPYPPSFLCTVETAGTRLLDYGGGRWRVAQLGGDLLGMHAEASIAHVLPA